MADSRSRITDAFFDILAEKPFGRITLKEIADRAELSLADLRAEFGSTLGILAGHMRDTDRQVLDGIDPELADTPARERLFDVLMRRIEILAPRREAVRSLARAARRDPALALALNRLSLRSHLWMLEGAGISSSGLSGQARAQGLVYVFARTLQVWFDDDDPGLARTMAALDRELAYGERMINLFGDLCRFVPRFGPRRARRRRGGGDDAESAAA